MKRFISLGLLALVGLTIIGSVFTLTRQVTHAQASTLKVQYKSGTSNTNDQQLTPYLQVVNTGSSSVALNQLKIRYWFTRDTAQPVTVACDWAALGCSALTFSATALSNPVPTADYYIEVGFASGTLAANGTTGEIQLRTYKTDWSSFTQSNDYSYDGSQHAYVDWSKAGLYQNGTLVWGLEPNGSTPPSPTPTSTPGTTPTPAPTSTPIPTPTAGTTPTPNPTPNPTPTPPPSGAKQVVGYFAQWGIYQRGYQVKNIETSGSASKLTTINYAFGNVSTDNKCFEVVQLGQGDAYADYQKSFSADQSVDGVADTWSQSLKGNFNQLKKLKAKHPNLKVLISLGGWTWSGNFSTAAQPQNRAAFVQSCIDLYIKGNLPQVGGDPSGGPGSGAGIFDGIDIDWEYPAAPGNTGNVFSPADTQNFTALLAEFRRQLDALGSTTGKHYLLTIAAPAGQDKYQKIELNAISQYLDWMNLMAYDMHGAWDAQGPTNFHAPIYTSPNDPSSPPANTYSIDHAVTDYLAAGVPSNKLVLGLPFYGRGWTNVPNANNGLYQKSSSMQPAHGSFEPGIEDYKVLKNLSGFTGYRDPITKAFWVFDGSTFWSYDDPTSIATKLSYARSKNLGGAMIWELDGDDASGTLMQAVADNV